MSLILITTSHKPSQRTRSFIKDLSMTLPYSATVNRGKKTLEELGIEAHRHKARYIFVAGERRGNPSIIRIYRVDTTQKIPKVKHIASIIIKGVKLTRENPEATRAYNPETIKIDYMKCISDQCFKLSDLFYSIYEKIIDEEKPEITLLLEENDKGRIVFKPINRLGKTCGPIIIIKGVRFFEEA